jgi:Flp pilus assembly pilin Flp
MPFSPQRFHRDQWGTSSIELVLLLPLIALAMMFLVGMGFALQNKQQSIVVARYAARYDSIHGAVPSPDQITKAVRTGPEQWRVTSNGERSAGEVTRAIGDDVPGVINSAITSLLDAVGVDGVIVINASTRPVRGPLPGVVNSRDAEARYYLASGTWTCEKDGSYIGILFRSVPLVDLSGGLSCCETYKKR